MKDLRGDSPAFRPGNAMLNSPESPRLKFKKFNPNRTFHVKEEKFTPHAQPFTPPVPAFSMPEVESTLSQMYHPPLHPLQYHLYAPTPSRLKPSLDPHQRTAEDLFIDGDLRNILQERNEATLQILPTTSLPEYVHVYHSLVPLDTSTFQEKDLKTWKYKAISNTTGRTVCLMRVENFNLTHEQAMSPINKWNKVKLAGLVGVLEAFTTLAFGDNSLVVVYEYFPLSETLEKYYPSSLPEGLVWSIAAQLTSTIHQLHKKQLYARIISRKSVIVTQKDRVRIGSCGAEDVVALEKRIQEAGNPPDNADLAIKDWRDLGALLRSLMAPPSKLSTPSQASKYSGDLNGLVEYLTNESQAPKADHLLAVLAPHILRVMDSALLHNDNLEDNLSRELENARLFRLMAKLEFILNRPDDNNDPRWTSTGDRYPLKLFLDFVFHQKDDNGKPSLDLAHALVALNKLDAGVEENVLLISHDEQTKVIMSYKELKMSIEQAFKELKQS